MSESEDLEERTPPPPADDDDADDDAADLISMVKTNEKGEQVIGLGQYIEKRKEMKAQKRELKELRAKVEGYAGIEDRLARVMPIAEAVEKDKHLAAEIKAVLDGTRRSQPTTEQPGDDKDALEYAEVHGLVTKDQAGNDVYDVARARRGLDIEARNGEKRWKPEIDRANEAAFGMRGEQNLAAMYNMTTKAGEPLATDESIKEVLRESQMPLKALADPRVAKTVARLAAGMDREEGRTPKEPIQPMYLERPTNRRNDPGGRISEADRRMAARVGLTDADLAAAGKFKTNRKGEVDLE